MEAEIGQVLRFEPYADYFQFVLSDAEADTGQLDGDTWVKALKVPSDVHVLKQGNSPWAY